SEMGRIAKNGNPCRAATRAAICDSMSTASAPDAASAAFSKPEDQNKAKESGVITILLGKDDNVFYYEGQLDNSASNFKSSNFTEIRNVILDKKARTPEKDLVVVLKPSEECTYRNVVDILDEMAINVCKRYALVDISPVEAELVKASEAANAAAPAK
ncbi:MAG TPA: biopolymer transporter ExbD, partial [Sediminibacterium sp.]|nr:biopolymer transporter ExbD [Sediminibacterium sp.]